MKQKIVTDDLSYNIEKEESDDQEDNNDEDEEVKIFDITVIIQRVY